MKQLVIDARCLASGIGTYGFNLLSRLCRTELDHRTHVITNSDLRSSVSEFCSHVTALNVPIYSVSEQLRVPLTAPQGSVLHALHYNAPILHPGPLLVTIHDLTHILHDDYRNSWRSWLYAHPMLKLAAHRADHIFTGSEYTKHRIIERLGVSSLKITVAPYGVSDEFCPGDLASSREAVVRRTGSSSPYILFVGNLKPHKNLDSLLRAFSQLVVDRSFNYRLVVVGDDRKYRSSVMTRIRQLHLQTRVEVISGLGQGQLIDFYRAAEALVLPSFEEGFGLPVLEAMACDTPVICSHAASLPEVGGDAVQYFDPYSPEDMAQRIGEVLGSDEKRTRLSSLGRARSKLFTWDKTFENHLRIYRNYLEQPSATAAVAEQHSW